MFAYIYLAQEEDWRLDRAAIAIYTNFFLA